MGKEHLNTAQRLEEAREICIHMGKNFERGGLDFVGDDWEVTRKKSDRGMQLMSFFRKSFEKDPEGVGADNMITMRFCLWL